MKKAVYIIIFSLITTWLNAQSDLLITPYRVIFEGGKKMEEVSVANTGQDTARYAINFVQYRMTTEGKLEQIPEPEAGQYFADRYIRVFPRTITLAPNEAQIVRLQVKAPSDLIPAEYRSHLYFRSIVDDEAPGTEATADTSLGIKLTPVYGITIPVIMRVGDLDLQTSIEQVELVLDPVPVLKFSVTRSGSKSAFGDIEVNYTDAAGNKMKAGSVKGVAVYTPLSYRRFTIPLDTANATDYRKGQLKIAYTTAGAKKQEVMAEYTLKPE
jgi:hypothetical protein